jgi:F-type H+-transporting ATPase subunit O
MSAAAAPVTKFGTPGRYANAIYAAAAQKNALAAVTDDLSLLKETLKASATLHHFVTNPSIPRETKASGIVKLLTSAKADVVTKNAMATLAEGGRMHDVFKVIDNYMEIITAAKGEVNAVITSAAPLPEEEKAAIRAQLVSFLVRCRPAPAYARDSPPQSRTGARLSSSSRAAHLDASRAALAATG